MLDRIRRACRQSEQIGSPEEIPDFPSYSDPVARFRDELEKVGGIFLDARDPQLLPSALRRVLEQSGAAEIYWESEDIFERHGIAVQVRNPEAFSRDFLVYSFHFRQEVKFPLTLQTKRPQPGDLAEISLSASTAEFGVAETGTIVHAVRAGKGRLMSVLPPAHVVLLSERNLLMNQRQLFTCLSPGKEGSILTLVTGPSRTADIEKTLVIGVHGPKQWFVILTA